jgi:hypothetical protein
MKAAKLAFALFLSMSSLSYAGAYDDLLDSRGSKTTTIKQRVGDTTFSSDGSMAIDIGDTRFYSDGSVSTKVGDTRFYDNGDMSIQIGDTLFNSDGTMCMQLGSMISCN